MKGDYCIHVGRAVYASGPKCQFTQTQQTQPLLSFSSLYHLEGSPTEKSDNLKRGVNSIDNYFFLRDKLFAFDIVCVKIMNNENNECDNLIDQNRPHSG